MANTHIDNFPTAYNLGGIDYGAGVHLSGENGGYNDDSLNTLASLKFSWAKLLNFGNEPPNPQDSTYGKLLKRKIYPITRIYRDKWGEITPQRAGLHTDKARMIIQACGYNPNDVQPLVQIYNELNNIDEWYLDLSQATKGYPPNAPELAADAFYWASLPVIQKRGKAITPPTSPGGSWEGGKDFLWAIRFTKALKTLADTHYTGGSKVYFTEIAYGCHPYTDTKWLDWGKGSFYKWDLYDFRKPNWQYPPFMPGYEDNQGFYQDVWVHDMVWEITGVEVNIIDCEGGFCANGGNFYREDIVKSKIYGGGLESWKMPPPMHASYITSQIAHLQGITITDPVCVREPLAPAAKWRRNTAFWTWGVQGGWWQDCDIRSIPATLDRLKQYKPQPRDTKPSEIIVTTPPPVYTTVKKLQVTFRAGANLVQGNLPKGTEIVIGYWGNDSRHRVTAGSKPELGLGGFEQVIYGEPQEIKITVNGYEPLTTDARGHIPFITEAPIIDNTQVPPPPPVDTSEFKLAFESFDLSHKDLKLVPRDDALWNKYSDAVQAIKSWQGEGFLLYCNREQSRSIEPVVIYDKNSGAMYICFKRK